VSLNETHTFTHLYSLSNYSAASHLPILPMVFTGWH